MLLFIILMEVILCRSLKPVHSAASCPLYPCWVGALLHYLFCITPLHSPLGSWRYEIHINKNTTNLTKLAQKRC